MPSRTTLLPNNTVIAIGRRLIILLLMTGSVTLSGCADWLPEAHRMDLQQGNSIKREQLKQLNLGMSKDEVKAIIGLPMIADPFHQDRWDYIYRFIPGKGFERKSRLTLRFDDGLLAEIDDRDFAEP